MIAIFIDLNPVAGKHEFAKIDPVIDRDWSDEVVERARKFCPKTGRIVHLVVESLPGFWETYDPDRERLAFFAAGRPGRRRWNRTVEEVYATLPDGKRMRTVLYKEQRETSI